MTERPKKKPKVAWRDLMKGEAETPAEMPADASAKARVETSPDTSPQTSANTSANASANASANTSANTSAKTTVQAPAKTSVETPAKTLLEMAAKTSVEMPAKTSVEMPAKTSAAETPAAIPAATPATRDAARVTATRPAAAEPATAAPATTPAPRATASRKASTPAPTAAGAPPDYIMPLAAAATITEPAPPQSPEAEVNRILARLATYTPGPRPEPALVGFDVASIDDGFVVPRGPGQRAEEEEAAPTVTPAGLREAARVRRGRVELLLFRAGGELFALPLGAVEEAIEAPAIQSLPEMPVAMLGVFQLRERLVPTYSPGGSLGVVLAEPAGAALLVRSGDRRIALAADDVEDVMELDLSTLRDPPVVEDTDGILLGVARFARELVGVLDADALIVACIGGRTVEIP